MFCIWTTHCLQNKTALMRLQNHLTTKAGLLLFSSVRKKVQFIAMIVARNWVLQVQNMSGVYFWSRKVNKIKDLLLLITINVIFLKLLKRISRIEDLEEGWIAKQFDKDSCMKKFRSKIVMNGKFPKKWLCNSIIITVLEDIYI